MSEPGMFASITKGPQRHPVTGLSLVIGDHILLLFRYQMGQTFEVGPWANAAPSRMNEKSRSAKLLRLSGASVQSGIAEGRHPDGNSTRTNPKKGFGFLGPRYNFIYVGQNYP
jgi:hypothetical protein